MTDDANVHARTATRFAEALSAAIRARGMTLAGIQERLAAHGNPVSRATLSYWRAGARHPEGAQSLAVVSDLELVLGLDPGALEKLLGPSLRTGPLGPTAFPFSADPVERRVREVFQAMGATYPDPTRELSIHTVTDVGPQGGVLRRTTRMTVQATSGVVAAIPFVEITNGTRSPLPDFEALGGGRISTTHTHDSGEVHGFLFELDRPIITPETTMIEWAVSYAAEFPDPDGTGYGVAFQARELLLWMRFDPTWLPDWCEEVEETSAGRVITPRMLNGAHSLYAIRRSFGPGALSIRWGRGERPQG